MTEKQYTIVNMGLDGQYIKENGKIMTIERVVDLLNENEQLKNMVWHNYEEHKRCVNNYVDKIKEVEKENKQLKEYNSRIDKILGEGGVILTKNQLKSLIEMKNDDSVEVRYLKSANAKLKDENQSLKNHIQMLQKHIKRLENDNIKTYTLIKEAYKTERTALGKSVLKQLLEAIQ